MGHTTCRINGVERNGKSRFSPQRLNPCNRLFFITTPCVNHVTMTPYGGASSDVKNSQSLVGQLRRYYGISSLE